MLVAEVVSPSSRKRDYEAKRREYLAFGIREYWIVDFELGRVVVLVRESGQLIGSDFCPASIYAFRTCGSGSAKIRRKNRIRQMMIRASWSPSFPRWPLARR